MIDGFSLELELRVCERFWIFLEDGVALVLNRGIYSRDADQLLVNARIFNRPRECLGVCGSWIRLRVFALSCVLHGHDVFLFHLVFS